MGEADAVVVDDEQLDLTVSCDGDVGTEVDTDQVDGEVGDLDEVASPDTPDRDGVGLRLAAGDDVAGGRDLEQLGVSQPEEAEQSAVFGPGRLAVLVVRI